MKKNFNYGGYGSTLYKNDIILNEYLPEVKPVRGLFVDDLSQPIDYNPVYISPVLPIEQPIEQPIQQPIGSPKFVSPIFIDDTPPPLEQPIEMPIETPKNWWVNPKEMAILPLNETVFVPKFPDYSKMTCSELQAEITELNNILATSKFVAEVKQAYDNALSDAQNIYIANCGNKEASPSDAPIDEVNIATALSSESGISATGGFVDDSDKKSLPIREISKNLKPYIYAGLGIVAILIISRMITKNS